MPEAVPAGANASIGDTGIEAFLGLAIETICPTGFGKTGDVHNHCAHFVCHALRFTGGHGLKCSVMDASEGNNRPKNFGQMGVLIRVNQLYQHVKNKTALDTATAQPGSLASGLIFVTLKSNLSSGIAIMGEHSKKHVGIMKSGTIYHYGNTEDGVRKDSLAKFVDRMVGAYGSDIKFVTSTYP